MRPLEALFLLCRPYYHLFKHKYTIKVDYIIKHINNFAKKVEYLYVCSSK